MKENQSRSSQTLSDLIKAKLLNGDTPVGSLLPSIRKLTATYGFSLKTVHRALHILVEEGYLSSEPCRGYRVLPLVNDPLANSPLIFIMGEERKEGHLTYSYQRLFEEIKKAASQRGWSLLIITSEYNTTENILKQIKSSRAFGIILEGCSIELTMKIKATKVPLLSIESWNPITNIDSVVQDGQMGSIQATEYFLNKGYKKIIWFGSSMVGSHRDDRLSGYLTSMVNHNIFPKTDDIFSSDKNEIKKNARLILKKRPQGIVALWHNFGIALIEVAEELGLKFGKDFEFVTWVMEESIDNELRPVLKNLNIPVITWSGANLARSAISIIASKRLHADMPPIRVKIPTSLQIINIL